MEAYSCRVRLGGSLHNEVLKPHVSAADVLLLRHIHGEDAVTDIKHVGPLELEVPSFDDEKQRETFVRKRPTDRELRAHLTAFYGTGEFDSSTSGSKMMQTVFGPPTVPLPKELDDVEHKKEPKAPRAGIRTVVDERAEAGNLV